MAIMIKWHLDDDCSLRTSARNICRRGHVAQGFFLTQCFGFWKVSLDLRAGRAFNIAHLASGPKATEAGRPRP